MTTTTKQDASNVVAMADYSKKHKINQGATSHLDAVFEDEPTSKPIDLTLSKCGILYYYTALSGTRIVKELKSKTGDFYTKDEILCSSQVKIVEVLYDDEEKEFFVRFDITRAGITQSVVLPMAAFSSLGKTNEYTNAFTKAGGFTDNKIGGVLSQVVDSALSCHTIPLRNGYKNPGWHGETHIRPTHELCTFNINCKTEQAGTFVVWQDAINTLLSHQPKVGFLLSMAVGSYVRGLKFQGVDKNGNTEEKAIYVGTSNYVNLYTKASSTGKTTTLSILQSIEQSIEDNILDFSTTNAAAEKSLAASHHGFMCFDEMISEDTNGGTYKHVKRLMHWANGGGRAKMQQGESRADRWNTTIFLTSNESLSDIGEELAQFNAYLARSHEIDFDDMFVGVDAHHHMQNCFNTLLHTYGVAYPVITREIWANRETYYTTFKNFDEKATAKAKARVSKNVGVATRKNGLMALTLCGADILEAIGINVDADKIYDECMAIVDEQIDRLEIVEVMDKSSWLDDINKLIMRLPAYVRVHGYLATCPDHLTSDDTTLGYTARQKQEKAAEEHNKSVREVLLEIVQPEPMSGVWQANGFVCIYSAKRIKALTDIDIAKVAKGAEKAGKLKLTEADIKLKTKQTKHNGLRCYKIYMSNAALARDYLTVDDGE